MTQGKAVLQDVYPNVPSLSSLLLPSTFLLWSFYHPNAGTRTYTGFRPKWMFGRWVSFSIRYGLQRRSVIYSVDRKYLLVALCAVIIE